MPKFSGKSIGGTIEFDFTDWNGPEGQVPEPSKFMVKKFMKDIQQVFVELKLKEEPEDEDDVSGISANELVNIMNDVDQEEVFEKLTEGITDCLAVLCGGKKVVNEGKANAKGEMPPIEVEWVGGSPSHAVLSALPYRPFMGFFGYLMENLMNPQLSGPDTNTSPARLRSV